MSVPEASVGAGSLADQAYSTIKGLIVTCELAPGQRITERVLAKQLGLGLSPIRNALVRLDNEGLVTTRPRSGYRIAPLTIEDVDGLFDAWSVIGAAIIERAAQHCTDADRQGIEESVTHLRRDQEGGQADATANALAIAQTIWREYCRIAGNSRLTEMWKRLDGELQRVFVTGAWDDRESTEHYFSTLGENELRLGDPEASVTAFRTYIDGVHRHLLERLQASTAFRTHEIVLRRPPPR